MTERKKTPISNSNLKITKKITKIKAKKPGKIFFSKDDAYFFGQGVHYDIYKKLGAHPSSEDGKEGYFFAVWAPHAKYVAVTGEFNGWDTGKDPMICDNEVGVWTRFIPDVREGDKVTLIGRDGSAVITMEELGDLSGRFNYELACDIGKRVPRVYTSEDSIVQIILDGKSIKW